MSSPRRRVGRLRRSAAAVVLLAGTTAGQLPGAELEPDDLASVAQFGASVALRAGVAAVGAPFHDAAGPAAGAVFVERLVDGTWQEEALLVADDAEPAAHLGRSLAFDGTTLAAGAPGPGDGGVSVFTRALDDGVASWTLEAHLPPLAASFGTCVGVDGDTLVVGTFESLGRVFVHERDEAGWTLVAVLQPDDLAPGDAFGSALALDGERLLVGAPRSHVDAGPGRAFVYERLDGAWTLTSTLVPDEAPLHGGFGYALALDGERCLVGAYESEDSGAQPGQAYVFRREGDAWTQEAELRAALDHVPASFGQSVALSGELAVVGAFSETPPDGGHGGHEPPRDDGHEASGTAYVFRRLGPLWTQVATLQPDDPDQDDQFARALDASGTLVLVGAPMAHDHGEAYVFEVPPLAGTWLDLGLGLPGASGATPELLGQGTPAPAAAFRVLLRHALPGAAAWLAIGAALAPVPFHGGTLVPTPDLVAGGLQLDASGDLELAGRWPQDLLPGDLLALQAWVADDAAPGGLAGSNAVAIVAP